LTGRNSEKVSFRSDDKEPKPIHVPVRRRPLRGDYAEFFASTDKGYITNELWDSVIEKFLNIVTPAMNDDEVSLERKSLQQELIRLYKPSYCFHTTSSLSFDSQSLRSYK
jgi:hypothetical protein